jgi:hypothetical protein
MMKESDKIYFLTIIAVRKKKDALLTAMVDAGIHLINTHYGKGTVNASYLMNTLGFVPEKNKAVITCVSTCAKIDAFLKILISDFDFENSNTGIAFAVPVERVSF